MENQIETIETILTKSEQNKNNHSNYDFNDYKQYIKNVAYSFSNKTNIDIDEFISEAGLVWSIAISKHNPSKCSFIAYFKKAFRQSCIQLTKKEYSLKRGFGNVKISMDKPMDENNKTTLHSIMNLSKHHSIKSSDFCLLSDSAKQFLKMLSEYTEPKTIINQERKKMITANNALIKKTIGLKQYKKAIQEVCDLLPNAKPAKNANTLPIILTRT